MRVVHSDGYYYLLSKKEEKTICHFLNCVMGYWQTIGKSRKVTKNP